MKLFEGVGSCHHGRIQDTQGRAATVGGTGECMSASTTNASRDGDSLTRSGQERSENIRHFQDFLGDSLVVFVFLSFGICTNLSEKL
jgi:hypothetical protein